jgi:hypothetical protein
MALFTDGSISTISDLQQYESSVLDVAATERIDLAHKMEVSQREIALELTAFLLRKGCPLGPNRELSNVIVTESIAHWHIVHALELLYRDAYNSQVNDRYRGKWENFSILTDRAQRLVFDIGVGITTCPVPRAQTPIIEALPGSLLPANTYYVRIAWQGRRGTRGDWSPLEAITVPPGTRLGVTVPAQPLNANGAWVYAGTSKETLLRQNEQVVDAGERWTQPITGLRSDLAPIPAQSPDYYVINRREMLRG